jgi:hypothetical protein
MSFEAQELLMYGRTIVLERFLAYMNSCASRDKSLGQTTRDCNKAHLTDEVRHIAWDREVICYYRTALEEKSQHNEIQLVSRALHDYLDTAFQMLYNPRCYKKIGISDPLELVKKARSNPERKKSLVEWSSYVKDELSRLGMA